MIELVVISIAIAATVLVRVVMSRPPSGGVAKGLQGQLASGVVPNQTMTEATPPVARLLGAPPVLPLRQTLDAAPPLPPPQTPLTLLGVEVDRAEDERQLWLIARERLDSQSRSQSRSQPRRKPR